MKKLFLLSIWLLTLIGWKHQAVAQPSIGSASTGDVCPNQNYTYFAQGSTAGCSLNWQVSGGKIISGQNTGSIMVKWDDKPTSSSNVTSIKIDCGGTSSSAPFPVFVSSISDQTPGPLTINGTQAINYTLPFGDITTLTLYVPLVAIPNTTNAPYSALTYEWIIPSGWRYNDGSNVVSDGISPRRVTYNSNSGQAGNQISVTSAAGGGGSIRVRALNNNCVGASAGPVNSTSQQYSVDVNRTTPQLTIISDKSPNGGNFTLFCGDQSDYHFRSANITPPAGGVIDNYVFNFSGNGVITPTGNVFTDFTGPTRA